MGDVHASGREQTQQQIRQVLAPLARLVEDAEPGHLTDLLSMVDMLWPVIFRSHQRDIRWTLCFGVDIVCLLIYVIIFAYDQHWS